MERGDEKQTVRLDDELSEDPAVRGQNFTCMSFLSPEKVLKRKDVFQVERYLQGVSQSVGKLVAHLRETYPEASDRLDALEQTHAPLLDRKEVAADFQAFCEVNAETHDNDFAEANHFQTSVRGVKVRGSYGTLEEAKQRANHLKSLDPTFDVYVAQTGMWCPWHPDPEGVSDVEYPDQQLNTLMHKYKEGISERDEVFRASTARAASKDGAE
jgi:hypothetical protein